MEEQNHFVLQVVRVYSASSRAKDTAAYVELKLAESVRKTGILNDEGEPMWNGTVTFCLQPGASAVFEVHLKKVRKFIRGGLIGQAEVNIDELLAGSSKDNVRIHLSAPASFLPCRRQQSLTRIIHLHLKSVDTFERAKIEIETAERSAERIQTLANRTDCTMEVIGTVIEAADVVIKMVDTIAKIHPIFDVSWQVTSAIYKVVSQQFDTDKKLIDLVDKMRTAFKFSAEARDLDDKTKLLKPIVKILLGETAECARFVQKYTKHNFFGRMGRFGSGRKISDYSARFVDLRKELDSVIGLNTAKEVLDIKLQKQLEALLEPFKSEASNVSSRPRCLDGTRQEYLDPIMEFLFIETSPNVLWLTGAAGSGKSTIAVTAFERCGDKGYPPAYMFFEREKSDPSSVIRTLAYMLASLHPSIARHILDAVEANKTIGGAAIKKQFEKLLLEPLHAASGLIAGPVVVILDALDECGNAGQRRDLLRLLKTDFTKLPLKVRILVTSRPEGDIVKDLPQNGHIKLEHGTEKSRHDVDVYIRQEMAQAFGKRVPKGKIWDDSLRVLCDAADGLFIWASTAVKMVRGPIDPEENLQRLVGNIRTLGEHGLDSLYASVLQNSGIWQSYSKNNGTAVLGLILVAKEAMTGAIIAAFLGLEERTVDLILWQLQSVVSYEPGKPVRLHHASFADYVLTSGRSGKEPWHIDEGRQKKIVTERCFEIMAENLHFNVCHLESSSFIRNEDVPDLQTRIAENIRPHLDYACRFWAVHLCELSKSVVSGELKDRMKNFGKEYLLYWFEVLSLTGQFNRVAVRALYDASMWFASIDEDIYSLFWAAYRLASVFAYPISQSAPHIYLSAISLWKGESLIADRYSRSHPIVKVDRFGVRTQGQCIKVLQGNTDIIYSVAVSADGERIASGSRDETIRVWSAFSGEVIAGPFEVGSETLSVAFSPDGKQVVSGCRGGTIHVWDVDTGSPVSVFKASESEVTSVAFSPDGRRVISVSGGKVFYYENGELVDAHDTKVEFRLVTPDGKYVLGSSNSMIGIWDAGTRKRVSAPVNVDYVQPMTVSPDGKLLATVSLRGIYIWNVDSGKLVKELVGVGSAYCLGFSPDGRRVVSGGSEIVIWDVDSGQRIWGPFKEHTLDIMSVIFTPDGKRVISGSYDNTIRIWDVDGSTEIASGAFEAHTDYVRSVAFSPDGKRIVSGSNDNTIRIWDADSGEHLVGPFKGHTYWVNSVTFSPDGKRVLSGSWDGTIRIWNAESGELLADPFEAHVEGAGCEIERHFCSVYSAAFSPDGKHFVSLSCGNTICIRDADRGRLVSGPFKGHTSIVLSVGYSPDGKHVVSGSLDATICIWDADSGKLVFDPLEGHTGLVTSVAFSSNGKRVASGFNDRTIRIWDAGTGKLILGPLEEHRETVESVCFSPDGFCVVSGSWDKTICIWNAETGELILGPLEGHTSHVLSVAYSPDGMRVVSGSGDKTIRVWDVGGGGFVPGCGGRLARRTMAICSSPLRADTLTGSNDQGAGPTASRGRMLSNWTLSEDGWVKGEGGELLTWIPEDMRGVLWRARNTAFFSTQFSLRLDFQNSSVGEDWARGYSK